MIAFFSYQVGLCCEIVLHEVVEIILHGIEEISIIVMLILYSYNYIDAMRFILALEALFYISLCMCVY